MVVQLRAQPIVVVTADTPVISNGLPVMPRWLGKAPNRATAILGPKHIHTISDPSPKPNPNGSYVNPPKTRWTARWSVDTLPDPSAYSAGYYWLGDPSSADGTSGIQSGARRWAADGGRGPSWHSFYPYKPSVVALNHYLFGGQVVHHPKGVNFNSHFIEHMWMDWGSAHRQPFTWVIAACVTAWQSRNARHYLLDSGRNPDDVGFPRISASATGSNRLINDNLPYRNAFAVEQDQLLVRSATDGAWLRGRTSGTLHPKMYIASFAGGSSRLGAWSPSSQRLHQGSLANAAVQHHRYYVLGRANGHIGQPYAGSLLVFEMRYFNFELSRDQLREQYEQISATYHFNKYRNG